MTNGFNCADKQTLIAYVYEECDEATRRVVEAHLRVCPTCADEMGGLGTVRHVLAGWEAPDLSIPITVPAAELAAPPSAVVLRPRRWWQAPMPGWARAAAAVLLFAGGAALANIEVTYGKDGVTVRTGWMRPQAADQGRTGTVRPTPDAAVSLSRDEIDALHRRLDAFDQRLAALPVAAGPAAPVRLASTGPTEEQLLVKVRALLDESEQRQQSELAYRLTEVVSDLQTQQRAGLLRVQQGLGQLEGRAGAAELMQRQLLNRMNSLTTVSFEKK